MTADEIREQLADWTGAWTQAERDDLLDVVQALIAKGAAAELRGLLPSIDERATASRFQAVGIYCRELARKIRARAAALDGTP